VYIYVVSNEHKFCVLIYILVLNSLIILTKLFMLKVLGIHILIDDVS
jgi:hypothetical protein